MAAAFDRFLYAVYCAALLVFAIFGGGLLYLTVCDTPAPQDGEDFRFAVTTVLAAAGVVLAAAMRLASRKLLFVTILLLLIAGTSVVLGEVVARALAPAWPACALHGVEPDGGGQAWGRIAASPDAVPPNSWGQRDRERSVRPPPGVRRIAAIGDSFLEESPAVPVSLQLEQALGRSDWEVINLGVSASGPEEYYYRTKYVALPLGATHCIWFLFAGNDFAEPPRTLEGFYGVAAVSPRGSLLSALGLRGLNHLLTNHRRPVLQAWAAAGDLGAQEQRMHALLQQADDATMRNYLLWADNLPPDQRANLAARLDGPEIESFFEMLRHPDGGWFRSYYLSNGLWSAAVGGGQWDPNSEQTALYWVRQAWKLCRDRGIGFTLVIVPEAFQVDSRMHEQWLPLADMRHLTAPCRDAADRLRESAAADGIDLLDLHPILADVPGAYLNLDGHWSETGAERAAAAVAQKLQSVLD